VPKTLSLDLDKNRWVYFLLFFATNCVISFSTFSWTIKLTAGLFGLVLPLYVALRVSVPVPRRSLASYSKEMKNQPTQALWLILLFFLVFLRFFKLATFPCWPNLDEGWIGTIALDLSRHWRWKFFYTFGETPPLTEWVVAGLFKLGFSPAVSLWFTSALASTLTVPLAYLAARQYFSKSFSFICGCLFAFSTWPLFMGRFCHQGIWLPLWVCLCLFLFGRFLKSRSPLDQRNTVVFMGFGVGLGSFIFTPWPVVAAAFGLTVYWKTIGEAPRKPRLFLYFLAAFSLSLLPFLFAVYNEGFGQHILSLSPSNHFFYHWDNFIPNFTHYLTTFVWSSFEPEPAYAPVEGGFLNPLLGAFFWMGLVEMWRLRRHRLIQWVAATFGLFLLPGILSMNLETFRVAQVLPLLLLITALGTHSFLISTPQRWLPLFLLLLIPSTAFDFLMLSTPYVNVESHPEDFGRPLKSMERYRAFQVLEALQKEQGPGLIFTNFETQSYNEPTLSMMTYPFNAARNTALFPEDCRWAAVFVNIHYEPFLRKRFPEGQWLRVSRGLDLSNGGEMLGLLPVTTQNQKTFLRWFQAHQAFQEADQERFFQNNGRLTAPLKTLKAAYASVHGDPFLESVYWDKTGAFDYENRDYDSHRRAAELAVTRGYPTADLYCKLGEMLMAKENRKDAKIAFRRATQAPLDETPSKLFLDWLNRGLLRQTPPTAKP
jgi:4-amino-4-deoxy-L-arabinose transferase-like glycosyltransferase